MLEWKRPFGTVTATASRFDRRNVFAMDAGLAADAFYGLAFDGDGRSVLFQPTNRVVDSAEIRFASDFKGRFQLLAGAFLQNERRSFRDDWKTVNPQGYPTSASSVLLLDTTDTLINERAVFGEASFEVLDRLKITGGLRWFDFTLSARTATLIVNTEVSKDLPQSNRSRESGVIPRFNIAYRASDQVNLYLQAAQGFRSGGVNNSAIAAAIGIAIPNAFGSDRLWNYEMGLKADLFNRKWFVDVAAYYLDWSDIQVRANATNGDLEFAYTANGGGANVKGLELQAQGRPLAGLSINGTVSFSDARLSKDNQNAAGVKGDRIPYVPRWQWSGGVKYEATIGKGDLRGFAGFDISYTSARATNFNPTAGADYFVLRPNTIANARFGLKREGWSVTIGANNIFNDLHAIDYARIVPGLYPTARYINQPRTFLLNVMRSF